MHKKNIPYISVILVTRNEEKFIEMSLTSIINQTYPKDKYEIIVVDGLSEDNTLNIIKNKQNHHAADFLRISILINEKKILSSGWNLGIKAAKGEYVTRIDAHAIAEPNFIEKSVETIKKVDAICVGGKLISKSIDGEDNIISKVLSSPFGVGNSSFRVSKKKAYADTAVYGLYKKTIFNEIGYFDETTVRNQDIELHSKIRKAGYRFYFNPEIKSIYYTRNTLKKMLKQAVGNGQWNMILIRKGTFVPAFRHLVPFLFVLYLIVSVISGFLWSFIWLLSGGVILVHLFLGFGFATRKTANIVEMFEMSWLFLLLHFSYGYGYIKGIVYKIRKP